jgi:hypothetical protein
MKNNNLALVQNYFQCLANGDYATLGSLFSDDVRWHQPGNGALSKTYNGKAELFALFGRFMEISTGSFRIDQVDHIMANGDLVTAMLQFSAKKANGENLSMSGVDLMRIADGKIVEVWLFSGDQTAEDNFWGLATN